MRNIIVTAASGQDRYTNSQKASYIAHSAIVHYPAIYVRYTEQWYEWQLSADSGNKKQYFARLRNDLYN
jgi:hypothetical protein